MFDAEDDKPNTDSTAQPSDGALTEPNPQPGILLTLLCSVEQVPAGADVLLVGSLLQYDEAQPNDEFLVEYRRTFITVKRCEVEHRRWR